MTSCSGVSQLGGLQMAEFDHIGYLELVNASIYIKKPIIGIQTKTIVQYFVLSIFNHFKNRSLWFYW